MKEDKLKLDCTGCGAPLFQTDNPQVYRCDRCDTSFKLKFDSDGIVLELIKKKIKTVVEDLIEFKEKIKNDKLSLRCTTCNRTIFQTLISKEVYECSDCSVYYKAIYEEGKVQLVKPDSKILHLLDIEKKKDHLNEIKRNLEFLKEIKSNAIISGFLINALGFILISFALFVIIYEGILYIGELCYVWIIIEDYPWLLLIYPITFFLMWKNYNWSKKQSEKIEEKYEDKSEILMEIRSIEEKIQAL